jgi:hypothetical protein
MTPKNLFPVFLLLGVGVFWLFSGCNGHRRPTGQTINDIGPISPQSHCLDNRLDHPEYRKFLNSISESILDERLQATPTFQGYALLIGIDSANVDIADFQRLQFPSREAKLLANVLQQSGYRVKTLINEQATRENILKWFKFIVCLSGRHRIFFYYSGHGTIYGKYPIEENGNLITGIYPFLEQQLWETIETRFMESLDFPNQNALELELTKKYVERLNQSFFLIPYQEDRDDNHGPYQKFHSLVGYDELADILSTSKSPEKMFIIDACSASMPKNPIFDPLPVYAYELQRQGYMFFSLIKKNEKMEVIDGEFTPIIAEGLKGAADRAGDQDGVVTAFELIKFANTLWKSILQTWGVRHNRMNFILYGSDDFPLTIVQ